MTAMTHRQEALALWALAAVVSVAGIAYGLADPGYGGDSTRYVTVARNILFNGCVSTAAPETALCTPHWGGNQFPGYPLLIALGGWLARLPADAGNEAFTPAIIVLQAVLAGLVAGRIG